jgi:hypothetical protein
VKLHHAHDGVKVEYGESGLNFVDPPYRYLWPHNLWPLGRVIAHNLRNRDRKVSWRFDRRRAMATFPLRITSGVIRRAARFASSGSNAS